MGQRKAEEPSSADSSAASSGALVEGLGGACLAAVGFAVLDAGLVMTRAVRELDPGVGGRVFVLCALACATAGAVAPCWSRSSRLAALGGGTGRRWP